LISVASGLCRQKTDARFLRQIVAPNLLEVIDARPPCFFCWMEECHFAFAEHCWPT
jgi:hypothetical protein